MLLIKHDHVVQTFAPKCPDHSLNDRVRPRRSNRGGDAVDTQAPCSLAEVTAIDSIPIAEQMSWLLTPRGSVGLC